MNKIVVAPDSFKDCLSASQAAEVMKRAVCEVWPSCEVVAKPMADGGEGTLEALLASSDGTKIPIRCTGPLGEQIDTYYGIVNKHTAIIEYSKVAGLAQVPLEKRNPDVTTSYGVGEIMLDALNKECTTFILGLGGSATNDGGLGMLLALGMKAWDADRIELKGFGRDLSSLHKISLEEMEKRFYSVNIQVACDVDNPLCGPRGASYIYGPQKGSSCNQVKQYDLGMCHYADLLEEKLNNSYRDVAGAGAAGGLGFALLTLGAHLLSGAKLIADAANLEEAIKHADLVITGEGQSDEQTLYGKAPGYISMLAQNYGVPIVLISGSLAGDLDALRAQFTGCFSIINKPLSLQVCLEKAEDLLFEQTKSVVQFMQNVR